MQASRISTWRRVTAKIKKFFRRGFLICKEIFFSDYEYMQAHAYKNALFKYTERAYTNQIVLTFPLRSLVYKTNSLNH